LIVTSGVLELRMAVAYRPVSYHRVVSIGLVLLNVAAIVYAIVEGGAGRWDYHFRDGASFVTWLGSAQMLGAALLFVACYFAGTLIRIDDADRQENLSWLVFALGFFVLAIDQQFRLREYLTYLIDGVMPSDREPSTTATLLKAIAATAAIALVVYFRSTVLANFRMVVAFVAGLWFLVIMLLVHMLAEAVGLPAWLGKVLEGSGKLLAMAMFLSGSYIALLDRLWAANAAAQIGIYGDRRKRQLPISFPERRGRVEFGPLAPSTPSPTPAPDMEAPATQEPSEEARPAEPPQQEQAPVVAAAAPPQPALAPPEPASTPPEPAAPGAAPPEEEGPAKPQS
jgi:hypothetical protein